MTITPRSPQPLIELPLPLYQSVVLADAVSRTGDSFALVVGLDRALVAQLTARSLDETDTDIQTNSSDRIRFGEHGYEAWYAKDRTPFALVHQPDQTLAALIWFGPKALSQKSAKYIADTAPTVNQDDWHTMSYRSYPPWRGTGLMKGFGRFTIDYYTQHYPSAQLWVGLDTDNAASSGFAGALGFVVDEAASDRANSWLVMVRQAHYDNLPHQ